MKILIDKTVHVAALKSRCGVSFKLLSLIPSKNFFITIGGSLVVENEYVLSGIELQKSINDQ